MKKTLLIITGLMASGLPVHAAQISQADQAKVSQQAEPIPTAINHCIVRKGQTVCFKL